MATDTTERGYVTRKEMTNTTLRAPFGVEEHNRATVSRFIREAVDAGVIVAAALDADPKLMRNLLSWTRRIRGTRLTVVLWEARKDEGAEASLEGVGA